MIRTALCERFNLDTTWDPWPTMPPPPHATLSVDAAGRDDEDVLGEVVLSAYDIETDDASLREITSLAPDQRAAYFDGLRANYPIRREFAATTVAAKGASPTLIAKLEALGFQITQ